MERAAGEVNQAVDGSYKREAGTETIRRSLIAAFLGLTLVFKFILGLNISYVLMIVIVLWFISSFAFSKIYDDSKSLESKKRAQLTFIIFEILVISLISYLSAGIGWVSPILFSFLIVYANFWLRRRQAMAVTATIIIVFSAIALAENNGLIPPQEIFRGSSLSRGQGFFAATLLMLAGFFAMLAHVSSKFAGLLDERGNELADVSKRLEISNKELIASEKKAVEKSFAREDRTQDKAAELAEKNIELEIVNRIAFSLSTSLHIDRILRQILSQLSKLFPIAVGEITLLKDNDSNISYVIKNHAIVRSYTGAAANRLSRRYIKEVVHAKKPVVIERNGMSKRILDIRLPNEEVSDLVIFPIKSKNTVLGTLAVSSEKGKHLNSEDLGLIDSIMNMIGPTLENSQLYTRIKSLSDTDGVTSLYNRRYIGSRFERELSRAVRHNHTISIAMIDVDKLKMINDNLGHLAGDKALKLIATALIAACRKTDIVGRFGGDEFLVILPETDLMQTKVVAGRIAVQVGNLEVFDPEMIKMAIKPTVSIGVASYDGCNRNYKDLIHQADNNMYLAKRLGGNKIIFDDQVKDIDNRSEDGFNFPIDA